MSLAADAAGTIAAMDDAVPARISLSLDEIGVEASRLGPREWSVSLPCASRGAIAALLAAHERTLTVRAFVMRGPDRDHVAVYRRLLHKNLGVRDWRFGLDDDGDVFLAADAPLAGLDLDALDRLLGSLVTLVDETYETLVRTGFEIPDGTRFGPPPA